MGRIRKYPSTNTTILWNIKTVVVVEKRFFVDKSKKRLDCITKKCLVDKEKKR